MPPEREQWEVGDLIDAGPLVQHSANAMGFVNLIKAIDNNSLPWVINVVYSHGASLTKPYWAA